MNIDKKLDLLKQIREVDAPAFLLTRIKEQIQSPGITEAPVKWKWAFVATALVVAALNLSILFSSLVTEDKKGIDTLIGTMHMSTTNELYHE